MDISIHPTKFDKSISICMYTPVLELRTVAERTVYKIRNYSNFTCP